MAWNSGDPMEVARHYAEGGSLIINGGEDPDFSCRWVAQQLLSNGSDIRGSVSKLRPVLHLASLSG